MHADENGHMPPRWSMICQITLSLILPAMIILIFLPSLIFTYFEGWDYSISVYYSFVTMTTIGFGDYVPTFNYDQVSDQFQHQSKAINKQVSCVSFRIGAKVWHLLCILSDFCNGLVCCWPLLCANADWIHRTRNAKQKDQPIWEATGREYKTNASTNMERCFQRCWLSAANSQWNLHHACQSKLNSFWFSSHLKTKFENICFSISAGF